ncbi:hypothetical protein [Streptomyces lavendofoliae]|uniref:hypothetical protein n=1 Tax=Streptomyces lavendofoliae TaxID=67314 RepID=UPI003D910929
MDITTQARDRGVYVIRTVGRQQWNDGDGTWQGHGVCLDLMDGPRRLAVSKLAIPGTVAAEKRGAAEAETIEPWARSVRYLAVAEQLRANLDSARRLLAEAEATGHYGMDEADAEELRAKATAEELKQADSGSDYKLARLVVGRLERLVGAGPLKALAFAPDPAQAPVRPAWELPGWAGMPGASLAQTLARGLLEGWAVVREMRDPLVTWAVRDVRLTCTVRPLGFVSVCHLHGYRPVAVESPRSLALMAVRSTRETDADMRQRIAFTVSQFTVTGPRDRSP